MRVPDAVSSKEGIQNNVKPVEIKNDAFKNNQYGYLCDVGHFLVVSDVPELELPGRHVCVQQDGSDFNAPFWEYDVRTVFVAQTGCPVGELSGWHYVHRRHSHAHGHDTRVVRP